MSKYIGDSEENQFQPGSDNSVMLNLLGITDPKEMDEREGELLVMLYENLFLHNKAPNSLCFREILRWHWQWLGNVYPWAGKLRLSNIGKGGFQFASPLQFDRLIDDFERKYLNHFSSLDELTEELLVQHIAQSHVEFLLIHPVRDGNGRLSRLLIDMMTNKAGLGLLDYSLWDKNKDFYFRSIQAGVGGNYQHICRLVRDILFN